MTGHFYPAPDQMQSARSGVEPGVYRRSPEHYQKGVNYLDSEEQVVEMVAFIRQRPISYIGYHVEPKMHPSCAAASEEKQVWDPKAVRPLLCSFAVVERPVQKDKQVTYFFVVDAREAGTFKALALLLCRQVPFVSFDGACSLYCFWNAGLLEPGEVWDVQIFERMMTLGIFHHRYYLPGDADELGEIDCKNDCRELK